jgi:hypothetical protein
MGGLDAGFLPLYMSSGEIKIKTQPVRLNAAVARDSQRPRLILKQYSFA